MVTAVEGNRWPTVAAAGLARPPPIGYRFVAGTLATLGIVFLAPVAVNVAESFGPEAYIRAMSSPRHRYRLPAATLSGSRP